MRMWATDPKFMCRKHLLGEHVEMHMFVGTLRRGISIKGYINNNLIQPIDILIRHDLLVTEMERRGYNHKSPMYEGEIKELLQQLPEKIRYHDMDLEKSEEELMSRCLDCRARKDKEER